MTKTIEDIVQDYLIDMADSVYEYADEPPEMEDTISYIVSEIVAVVGIDRIDEVSGIVRTMICEGE